MLSYQMEKDTIDGKKTIIQNPTEKQRQEHEKVFDITFYIYCNFSNYNFYYIQLLFKHIIK